MTTEYQPKSHGVSLLKFLVSKAFKQPKTKFISVPIEQAKEILVEVQKEKMIQLPYSPKSNSVKAGALSLCMDAKELCERLNAVKPSQYMSDLAEARTKIKALEEIGDQMFQTLPWREQELIATKWVMAKKQFRK